MKDKLKAAGKQFLIDVYVGFYHDEILDRLRRYMRPLTPDKLEQLIAEGKGPPVPPAVIEDLSGYEDYIGALRPEEIFEWIHRARPDLAATLANLGDEGASYVVRLHRYLVDSLKNPQPAAQRNQPGKIKITCENCGEVLTMTREQADKFIACPFCGVGVEEKKDEE